MGEYESDFLSILKSRFYILLVCIFLKYVNYYLLTTAHNISPRKECRRPRRNLRSFGEHSSHFRESSHQVFPHL